MSNVTTHTLRGDWSISELTTATSGANESVGEPLRSPAREGLAALRKLSVVDNGQIIGDLGVEWFALHLCLRLC